MHHSDAPCRPSLPRRRSFVHVAATCARAAARSVGEGAAPTRLRACHQCRQPSIGRARAPHRTRARATRCHVMTHNPYAISYPCRTMNTWRKCCTPDFRESLPRCGDEATSVRVLVPRCERRDRHGGAVRGSAAPRVAAATGQGAEGNARATTPNRRRETLSVGTCGVCERECECVRRV